MDKQPQGPDLGLDLIPPQHLQPEARFAHVKKSVARLSAQYAELAAKEGLPTANDGVVRERLEAAMHEVVREYASLSKHLGAAPEVVVGDLKELVVTAAGSRRRVSGALERMVKWVIEGYYGK